MDRCGFTYRLWQETVLVAALCICVAIVTGCRPPAGSTATNAGSQSHDHDDHTHEDGDHDHDDHADHEHAETYEEAVGEIKEMRDSIRSSFAAGDPDQADDAVHEIGHLLDMIAELASHEDLSDADVNEIKQASDKAFEAYGQLDTLIHSGSESVDITYDDVSEEIDAAVAVFEAKLALLNEAAQDGNRDHAEQEGHDADNDQHQDAGDVSESGDSRQ